MRAHEIGLVFEFGPVGTQEIAITRLIVAQLDWHVLNLVIGCYRKSSFDNALHSSIIQVIHRLFVMIDACH